ncbi:MAG: DUF892 family protein [Saprospiraceae bacterium]|nr:DUF892 family protein [Saprospiraceae bacterium]MBP7801468.1 DUF892 family protein [Saprospiraceae bacterium]MBP8093961.1 DUF892 family protein [Saprospiraceae bacterium]
MRSDHRSIATLHDLFDFDIRRFIYAEIVLKKHLSTWIEKANSLTLKTSLQVYLDYLKQNVQQFETLLKSEEILSLSLSNKIMQAFIEETEEKMDQCADPEVNDACLLASVQSINHYKMSAYGTAAAFARALGLEKPGTVFHHAEANEKQIDEHLSHLAKSEINIRAQAPILLS